MRPPPPARLSMTIGDLSDSLMLCPTMRATMSTPLPGVDATIMRMGRVGYSCAWSAAMDAARNSAQVSVLMTRAYHLARARPKNNEADKGAVISGVRRNDGG